MTVVASDVTNYAPAFVTVDPARITKFIGYAETSVNREAWGSKADEGVILLTLHKLTLAARSEEEGQTGGGGAGTVVGAIKKKKYGPVETEFATTSSSSSQNSSVYGPDASLATTSWGLQYLQLRSTVFADRSLIGAYPVVSGCC